MKDQKQIKFIKAIERLDKMDNTMKAIVDNINQGMYQIAALRFSNSYYSKLSPNSYPVHPSNFLINQQNKLVQNTQKQFLLPKSYDYEGQKQQLQVQQKEIIKQLKNGNEWIEQTKAGKKFFQAVKQIVELRILINKNNEY